MNIKTYLPAWLVTSLALVLGAVYLQAPISAHADVPRVVVSIKPVYSLVSAVMAGAGGDGPKLIVSGSSTPHDFYLRPSDALELSRADIVFWIGPGLENFLARPLLSLSGKARIVELSSSPLVKTLSRGGVVDPHIWLDPRNARAIVAIAVAELSALDVANSGLYRDNGERMSALLDDLELKLRLKLAPVNTEPFIVSHDAYGYLVDAYGLNMAGYITGISGQRPGAGRLAELRRLVIKRKIRCLFHPPSADSSQIVMLGEGTRMKTPVLDPLGSNLKDGPEMYFRLMQTVASTLFQCLER